MTDKPSEIFSFTGEMRLRPQKRLYAGVGIGLLTILVAAAVFFCEMHITAAPVEQTAMTAAVTILSCFVMYTSLFDAGRQKAYTEGKYTAMKKTYETLRERAQSCAGEALEVFCSAYVEEELRRSREHVLKTVGESYETFLSYQAGEMPREEFLARSRTRRRALRRAERMNPLRLSAALLLCERHGTKRGLTLSARPAQVRRITTALFPTVCGSLVTVLVTLETSALTPAAVIAGLLRIFTLIWTGVRGYTAGGASVSHDECAALETKATLLGLYLADTPARA